MRFDGWIFLLVVVPALALMAYALIKGGYSPRVTPREPLDKRLDRWRARLTKSIVLLKMRRVRTHSLMRRFILNRAIARLTKRHAAVTKIIMGE